MSGLFAVCLVPTVMGITMTVGARANIVHKTLVFSPGSQFTVANTISSPVLFVILILVGGGTVFGALKKLRTQKQSTAQQIRELQAKLTESEERIRQAHKMEAMGQLAGGIAHDFNNLVTVIRCSLSLLEEYIGDDHPGHEEIVQIKEASERAGTLTRQLLTFSRRQALAYRPLDLNIIVRDLVKMLSRILGSHIQLTLALDQTLPQIFADLGQMEQVIVNLAVNARDAIPSTGGTLSFITARHTLVTPEAYGSTLIPAGQYITLSMKDTGQGMDPMVIQHAFEPFFTTKDQNSGTGLGLAIVHGIVYQTGGYIAIKSLPNTGTTVTIYFPTPIEVQQSLAGTRHDGA